MAKKNGKDLRDLYQCGEFNEEEDLVQYLYVAYRAQSTNFYNSKNFRYRHKDKDIYQSYVLDALRVNQIKRIPSSYKVDIEWQPIFKPGNRKQIYDLVNYSASIKMIEDLLVSIDIIYDDDQKYVIAHSTKKTISQDVYDTGFLIKLTASNPDLKSLEQEILKKIKV